ncbi:MAG: DUF4198 domain-containing protein [Methanothrix sp.]|nr:DUF4198 domain-containing protein [Methanothrix sp.]
MRDHKLPLMAEGHEIWLGGTRVEGSEVELSLSYGHNMRQDGTIDPRRISPLVYTPAGATLRPPLTPSEDRYLIRFPAESEGHYVAIADMSAVVFSKTDEGYQIGPRYQFKNVTYAGAFHQMAKTVIPVGDVGQFQGDPIHGILDIVPEDIRLEVSRDVALRVYYEGRPLPSAEIGAVSQREGGEIFTMKTDDDGRAKGTITAEGEWMFLARHRDTAKRVSEEFDETVFIATLVMEAR